MKILKTLLLAAALAVASSASAAPTQCVTDQAKLDFANGVNLAASTYKLALVTSTATCATSTTTWASISANEVGNSGSYAAGGATLAGRATAVVSNHAQISFTTPVTFTTATITARAAVIYNSTSGNVVACYCLDGGACAADTTSTGGTFSITLPTGVIAIN